MPESEADRRVHPARQIPAAEDGDDPRRMGERRELRHQLGRYKLRPRQALDESGPLRVDERFDGLEPGVESRPDEILSLAGEEPEFLPLPPRLELAHELEARVGRRGDQASSAAFACSAILPNAAGSETARSASTLRSSSMLALRQPATNWL